jgi:general secretion pathway protein J
MSFTLRLAGPPPPATLARRPGHDGFTLIELLVALFITAIIFTLGYGAINQALNNRDALKMRQGRLTAVETTMRVLVQDFTQLAPRPVRDILGGSLLPCLSARSAGALLGNGSSTLSSTSSPLSLGSTSLSDSSSTSSAASGSSSTTSPDLVSFTRGGWANPAGIQRPALERVSYRLENGVLLRMHLPVLDATETSVPLRRELLDHVKSVTFRYMTNAHQWTDQWPPLGETSGALRLRPFAIEVTLELEDWGRIVRIIEVPT